MQRLARISAPQVLAIAVGGAWLLFLAYTLGAFGTASDDFFDNWVYSLLLAIGVGACALRAITFKEERVAWALMATGMAAWTAGDTYWTTVLAERPSVPVPSLADALYLSFYPLAYATLVLLIRRQSGLVSRDLWVDGVIGSTCAAAVAVAVALPAFAATGGDFLEISTNLAYPALDVVLLVFVIFVFGLSGWRPGRRWMLIGIGMVAMAVSDGIYLVQAAQGTYLEGGPLDAGWPAAALLVGLAAWQAPSRSALPGGVDRRLVFIPMMCGMIALAIVSIGIFGDLDDKAVMPALITLLLVTGRLGWVFREWQETLIENRRDALTDGLTGLANRRQLLLDLERCVARASADRPWVCVLLDLDGFKAYNDAFGHPAGDDLLTRLGQRLAQAVGERGTAYRLGGDEFCVVARCDGDSNEVALLAESRMALTETGEAFAVTSSAGLVMIPTDTRDAADVLQLADRRMYADKGRRGSSAGHQSRAVLLRILREREPDLHEHLVGVAELAVAVARELGVRGEELDEVGRAAELHDVGKIAIPEEILHKPGRLTADEWAFIERHTVIGERILTAAPALRPVARLVRSTHERWDGSGYPDGLRGDEIPLGSRIVAVCDAYEAMISERPYRPAMSPQQAVEELRGQAGSQFDPDVVNMFTAALIERRPEPLRLG